MDGSNSYGKFNYAQRCADTTKFKKDRVRLSQFVKRVLSVLHVDWVLDGGNLLGAYRDGKMLPHDDDFDFAVHLPELVNESSHEYIKQVLEQFRVKVRELLDDSYDVRVVSSYAYKLEVFDATKGKYQFDTVATMDGSPPVVVNYHNVTCDITLVLKSAIPGVLKFMHANARHVNIAHDHFFPTTAQIKYEYNKYNAPNDVAGYLTDRYGYIGTEPAVFDKTTGFYILRKLAPDDASESEQAEASAKFAAEEAEAARKFKEEERAAAAAKTKQERAERKAARERQRVAAERRDTATSIETPVVEVSIETPVVEVSIETPVVEVSVESEKIDIADSKDNSDASAIDTPVADASLDSHTVECQDTVVSDSNQQDCARDNCDVCVVDVPAEVCATADELGDNIEAISPALCDQIGDVCVPTATNASEPATGGKFVMGLDGKLKRVD